MHIPNERKLTARDYAHYNNLKAIGFVAGAPDYIIYNKDAIISIEFKYGANKQSDKQKRFENWSNICGVPYYLCYNAKSAVDLVLSHFPQEKINTHPVTTDGQYYFDI